MKRKNPAGQYCKNVSYQGSGRNACEGGSYDINITPDDCEVNANLIVSPMKRVACRNVSCGSPSRQCEDSRCHCEDVCCDDACRCDPRCCQEGCSTYEGNNYDICLEPSDCEIKANLIVSPAKRSVRIWGRVLDCNGRPVEGALIKLIKSVCCCGCFDYEGLAHTVSDCDGFYQFEVDPCDKSNAYKMVVGMAATGKERAIAEEGNCKNCARQGRSMYRCD